jgi:hypothetical protein
VDEPVSFIRGEQEGVRELLPLLFVALRDNGVAVDTAFQTCLRTAYLRNELRNRLYQEICRNVVSSLATAGIAAIVLKGAALADTVYGDPVLQHAHAIDILLGQDGLYRAVSLLPALGFRPLAKRLAPEGQEVEVTHESGLPLALHRRLFHIPFYNAVMAGVWERSQIRLVAGVPARTLSPADNLLHVCGHAFYSRSHELLRWVCDSWLIIDRYRDLDWDTLLDCARRSHLALPLSVTLGYLAENLRAPIPAAFLDRLYAAASQTDTIGREAALYGVRTSARGGFKRLIQTAQDWRTRALIMKWALFPSPSYLRWVQQVPSPWLLPFYYVYRPLRYSARRVGSHHQIRARRASPQKDRVLTRIYSRG